MLQKGTRIEWFQVELFIEVVRRLKVRHIQVHQSITDVLVCEHKRELS